MTTGRLPERDIGTAETLAEQPAVTPAPPGISDTRGDMDTIPPDIALSADLVLLHAELAKNLGIIIESTERSGDTVVVRGTAKVRNNRATENSLTFLILNYYRGMTVHGKNRFTFDVPRTGGRMQKVVLMLSAS